MERDYRVVRNEKAFFFLLLLVRSSLCLKGIGGGRVMNLVIG